MNNNLIELTNEEINERLNALLEYEKQNINSLSLEELTKLRREIEELKLEQERRKSIRDIELDTSTFNNIEINDVSYEQQARENIERLNKEIEDMSSQSRSLATGHVLVRGIG